jgi:uncharacterized membrane protein
VAVADPRPRRSLRLGALVPAVLGLAISIYLTVEHYTAATTLACPDSGAINCAKVTTSGYSHFLGVPVALDGALYYLAMFALVLPAAWAAPPLRPVRLVAAGLGMGGVIYLVWAELFRIDAICLWCTAVHLCTAAMLVGIVWCSTRQDTAPMRQQPAR